MTTTPHETPAPTLRMLLDPYWADLDGSYYALSNEQVDEIEAALTAPLRAENDALRARLAPYEALSAGIGEEVSRDEGEPEWLQAAWRTYVFWTMMNVTMNDRRACLRLAVQKVLDMRSVTTDDAVPASSAGGAELMRKGEEMEIESLVRWEFNGVAIDIDELGGGRLQICISDPAGTYIPLAERKALAEAIYPPAVADAGDSNPIEFDGIRDEDEQDPDQQTRPHRLRINDLVTRADGASERLDMHMRQIEALRRDVNANVDQVNRVSDDVATIFGNLRQAETRIAALEQPSAPVTVTQNEAQVTEEMLDRADYIALNKWNMHIRREGIRDMIESALGIWEKTHA